MTHLEKIQEEIEQLSQAEKEFLAHVLQDNLGQSKLENQESIEVAWDIEIEKRIAEIMSGKEKGITADEIFAGIKL